MERRLSRRGFLLVSGGAGAVTALARTARAETASEPVFADGFRSQTLDEYRVDTEPFESGAATPSSGAGSASYDGSAEALRIETSPGTEVVVAPDADIAVPETGHVQLRVRVPRKHGDSYRFGVRLLESEDSWLGFRAVGDADQLTTYRWTGDGSVAGGSPITGRRSAGGGHHVFDFYWSPRRRAEFVDGDFERSSRKPDDEPPYDFDPVDVQLRALQCDVELTYWRLDHGTGGPPADADESAPGVSGTPTDTGTSGEGNSPSTATSARRTSTPRAGTGEWLDGVVSLAARAVTVPVVGSLVLGGLLAVSELRATDDGDGAE